MVTGLTGTFSSSNLQFMSKAAKVNHINFKRTFHSCGIKSPRRDITGPRIQNTEATDSLDLNHMCLGTKTHIPEGQTFWKEPRRPLYPRGVLFFPAPQNDRLRQLSVPYGIWDCTAEPLDVFGDPEGKQTLKFHFHVTERLGFGNIHEHVPYYTHCHEW